MPWEMSAEGDRLRGEIVRFIADHHHRLGYAPTLREVAAAVGRHHSTVVSHLHKLRRAGWVHWSAATPRSLTVTGPAGPDGGRYKKLKVDNVGLWAAAAEA